MEQLETIQGLLPRMARHGAAPAIITLTKDGKRQVSYAELTGQALRLAAGLAEAGIHKGEHVALCAEGSPAWFAACLGLAAAGVIAVPLDTQLADEALRHALHDSGARIVFTTQRLLKRVQQLNGRRHCEVVLLGERDKRVRGWEELFAEPADSAVPVSPDDRAVLFYTSGTTGPPKGVPLTHRNLAFQVNTLVAAEIVTSSDRILLPLPLHHVYPFTVGVLLPLAIGLAIVLPYSLTGPQIVRALREGEVTTIIGVPRLYRALLDGIRSQAQAQGRVTSAAFRGALAASTALARWHIRVGRLLFRRIHREMAPRLRILATGGAAIEPDLARQLEGLGWLVCTGYGLTETSPLLTFDKPGEACIGSVGRVLPNTQVRIDPVQIDAATTNSQVIVNGHDQVQLARQEHQTGARDATTTIATREGRDGEVVARGPGVFAGYHNLPDETRQAFTDDGWFRTGDLGHFDRGGRLYITGRVKTLIVLEGGEKVQPDDLEERLQQNPAIREIGVLEREGKIVAVIRSGRPTPSDADPQHADAESIRAALDEASRTLPSYQRISEFVLANAELPRTRLGKIRREELQTLYDELKSGQTVAGQKAGDTRPGPLTENEMQPDDRALLDEPAARQAWEWLAQRFSNRRLTPDSSLQLDLGIDSLEWVNLTLEIRQSCEVDLDEQAVSRLETVRDLLREIAEQPQAAGRGTIADPFDDPDAVLGDERRRWLATLGPVESAMARCLFALNKFLIRLMYRLSVKGRERLPAHGPFVLAPHHVSYLDSFVLAAVINHEMWRQTYWAGWSGIAFGPVFRFLRRLGHVVPIDPERSAVSSLAFGAAVLRDRHDLVWYPEGGHSKTGEVEPLKKGIGLLLEHYPVPVVPVCLNGTREALPPGRWLPRPGRVEIIFGAPLDPHDLDRNGQGATPQERIVSALYDEMSRLCRR